MRKKTRIGVLGLRGIPRVMGGIETHCEKLYPHLAENDIEIILFARKPYIDPLLKEYKGVRLQPLPCIKNKYLETYLHTLLGVWVAWLRRVDVLHIHAIGPGLFVPLARLLGMKVVFTHHGFDYHRQKWNGLARGILQLGERLACRNAHAVIAVAEYIGKQLEEKFRRKVHCIPNGVVMPSGSPDPQILAKYGLQKNRYIFALGRFVPEKGFHDLIEAYRKGIATHEAMRRFKLVIAGRADHADQYSKTLLGFASEQIVFTDFISGATLHTLFSLAGIFVIPSYHEGLPLALLEALSFGIPSLASDIPAHREIRLEASQYFQPGDIDTLTSKMNEYSMQANEADPANSLSRLVREKYDWEKIAQQTFSVYQEIVTG